MPVTLSAAFANWAVKLLELLMAFVFMPYRLDLTDGCFCLIYELEQKLFGAEAGKISVGAVTLS